MAVSSLANNSGDMNIRPWLTCGAKVVLGVAGLAMVLAGLGAFIDHFKAIMAFLSFGWWANIGLATGGSTISAACVCVEFQQDEKKPTISLRSRIVSGMVGAVCSVMALVLAVSDSLSPGDLSTASEWIGGGAMWCGALLTAFMSFVSIAVMFEGKRGE